MKMFTVALGIFLLSFSAVHAGRKANNSYGNGSYSSGVYGDRGTGSNYSSKYNSGYLKQNGTYVQPHFKSSPNKTEYDNWSTKGNVNPYTGKTGYKTPRK